MNVQPYFTCFDEELDVLKLPHHRAIIFRLLLIDSEDHSGQFFAHDPLSEYLAQNDVESEIIHHIGIGVVKEQGEEGKDLLFVFRLNVQDSVHNNVFHKGGLRLMMSLDLVLGDDLLVEEGKLFHQDHVAVDFYKFEHDLGCRVSFLPFVGVLFVKQYILIERVVDEN